MKVTIIGAGSAGLSAAIAFKRKMGADVRVLERASETETPGLGVALLPFAMNELRQNGLGEFSGYAEGMPIKDAFRVFAGVAGSDQLAWKDRLQQRDYWGVKRSRLVSFLRSAARADGIDVSYDADVSGDTLEELRAGSDLLVGADGAGSVVRAAYAEQFQPTVEEATSRYAWLELSGTLDQFLFGYVSVPGQGLIRLTSYPHSKTECSAVITHSAGLSAALDAEGMLDPDGSISAGGLDHINALLAPGLGGRRLGGNSRWRRFRATRCANAAFENVALIGDAYATVHYETGWGTSAALQEARVLAHIVDFRASRGDSVEQALALFSRKSGEIAAGLVAETSRVMHEIDGHSAQFDAVGPRRFLDLELA